MTCEHFNLCVDCVDYNRMSSFFSKRLPLEKELTDDGSFMLSPVRIGNCYLLCGKKKSRFPFQLFIGPDWCCMIATYCLLLGPSILFLNNIAVKWGAGVVIVGVLLTIITVW